MSSSLLLSSVSRCGIAKGTVLLPRGLDRPLVLRRLQRFRWEKSSRLLLLDAVSPLLGLWDSSTDDDGKTSFVSACLTKLKKQN